MVANKHTPDVCVCVCVCGVFVLPSTRSHHVEECQNSFTRFWLRASAASEAPSTVYGTSSISHKVLKNCRKKFLMVAFFIILHSESISVENRPDPARPRRCLTA